MENTNLSSQMAAAAAQAAKVVNGVPEGTHGRAYPVS